MGGRSHRPVTTFRNLSSARDNPKTALIMSKDLEEGESATIYCYNAGVGSLDGCKKTVRPKHPRTLKNIQRIGAYEVGSQFMLEDELARFRSTALYQQTLADL